jgi:hypothetical protein
MDKEPDTQDADKAKLAEVEAEAETRLADDEPTFRDKANTLAERRSELFHVNGRYLIDPTDAEAASRRAELAEEVGDLMDELEPERRAFLEDAQRRVQEDVLTYFRSLGYGATGTTATTGEGLDLILNGLGNIANTREQRLVPDPPDIDTDTAQRKLNEQRHGIALTHAELARYRDNPDGFVHGAGYSKVQRTSPEQAAAQMRRVLALTDEERV